MTEFKVDGNMTVKMLRDSFKETFGASLRVYKGKTSGRGARPADDRVTLKSLSGKQNLEDGSEFKVSDAVTIGEFEDSFLATFDLAVQVASYDDSRLLDNDMILKPGKKPKMKGEKDEDLPVKKDESIEVEPIVEPIVEPVVEPVVKKLIEKEDFQVRSHNPVKQTDSNKKILIYAALVLLLIILIGMYVFTEDKKNDITENIETTQVVETEEIAEVEKVNVNYEKVRLQLFVDIKPTKPNGKGWDTQGQYPDPVIKIKLDGNTISEIGPFEDVITVNHEIVFDLTSNFSRLVFVVSDHDHMNHDDIGTAEFVKAANQDIIFGKNYSVDFKGEFDIFEIKFTKFDNINQSLSQTTEKNIESIVKKIRAVFNETQSNLKKYKVDIIESDVEKLTAYFENGNVRLIQFETYGQNRDNYYYDNNNFIFMFNDGKQVNRYYFSGKKMIRWLDPAKNMMSENDDNFKMNEEMIYENAESLINQFLYK